TGGTDVTVKYTKPATPAAIARALEPLGVRDARVTTLAKTGDNVPGERYVVETQTDFGDDTVKIWSALGTVAPVDRAESQIEAVGPSLGREYLVKAGEALVIAIVIQFLFIAFRFGWNYIFGQVVVIALVRDALMMIGIYAIAQRRADDAFLAAVLTVIGYSVMDTIVILDRIRENVKVMPNEPYDKIVNTSILQTMTRSFNTLATVVITLVALLAFGGGSLQNFAFALLVGICSGGYHSIFYSAPLVHVMREREQRRAERRRVRERAGASERPRSVAEARAQARAAQSRDEILAARRERREREKSATRKSGGPTRYRKRRDQSAGGLALDEPLYGENLEDEIDPLDAQNAGLHDEAAELGHEEIRLNLEDEAEVVESEPRPAKHE
ncbi:MAG: protein translocase subunit SecF, partial [Candidatus Eremiobacteraeota bacterium]|nr:protein translocase subunit SecF [Candidatus Eremiobacteraeota bacterium]